MNIDCINIESHSDLIKYYPSCRHAWLLDLGRNKQFNPTFHLEFTPFTRLDPVSHRIIPSFRFQVRLDDPLEIASVDFIQSLSKSFQISLNDAVLQVFPESNVAEWDFNLVTNRNISQKDIFKHFLLQSENHFN